MTIKFIRYHYIYTRIAKKSTSISENVKQLGTHILLMWLQNDRSTLESLLQSYTNTIYYLISSLLSMHQEK
jgi:hypothetical protein